MKIDQDQIYCQLSKNNNFLILQFMINKSISPLVIIFLTIIIKVFSCEVLYPELQKAVFENNLTIATKLLSESTIDLDKQNESGNTLLHSATTLGNIDMIKLLLDNGADSNIQNNDGETPFFFENDKDILSLFLNNEADVNLFNKYGYNAFTRAIIGGSKEVVNFFLLSGHVKVNAKNPKTGDTALLLAIKNGNYDIVVLLLNYDAIPIIANDLGITALGMTDSYTVRTYLLLAYVTSLLKKHKDFYKAKKEIDSRMRLNSVIIQELAGNNKTIFNNICKENLAIVIDSDKTWLVQNIYEYILIYKSIKYFNNLNFKPKKYIGFNLDELNRISKDLKESHKQLMDLIPENQWIKIWTKIREKACLDIKEGKI